MNTPRLTTERLILRKFTKEDIPALFTLLQDTEVNRFLPWFPAESLEDATWFYQERILPEYQKDGAYYYAICMKDALQPIGYIKASSDDSHDFGYALQREVWGKGIATEAGCALLSQLLKDGLPYITATHDVQNPQSGNVMKRLGMKYQYSYEEQWQPKDFPVVFRVYQLNFDGDDSRVYRKYWEMYERHFVEAEV